MGCHRAFALRLKLFDEEGRPAAAGDRQAVFPDGEDRARRLTGARRFEVPAA